jgi:mRNA interferase MazF
MDMVKRFNVYWIKLDPTEGTEIRKERPCLVVSPDEMNKALDTVIIAPMTTTIRYYPSRVKTTFKGKEGEIALDQIRAVDKQRLGKKMGRIDSNIESTVLLHLIKIFGL